MKEKIIKNSKKKKIVIGSIILSVIIGSAFLYRFMNTQKVEIVDSNDNFTDISIAHEALDFPNQTSLATIGEYEYWQATIFRINTYDEIRENYKRAIVKIFMDNKYTTTGEYFLTNIKNRSKNVFAYGNFTGSAQKDRPELAFLIENADFTSSGLIIISYEGNLLYWKKYENELPIINSFSKGSKIFIDKTELEPSPLDGLVINFRDNKKVLLYDTKLKTFENFHQYTRDEIESEKDEGMYDEGERDAEIDSVNNDRTKG